MSVVEAQRYRDEEATLKVDPIIVAMTDAVRPLQLDEGETESWNFISAASVEYKARGGTRQQSIGGPARAIAALLKEAK